MSGPWGLRDSWQPASSNPGRRERKGKRKRVSNRRKTLARWVLYCLTVYMESLLPQIVGEKQVTGPTVFKGRDSVKAPIPGGRGYEGHFEVCPPRSSKEMNKKV